MVIDPTTGRLILDYDIRTDDARIEQPARPVNSGTYVNPGYTAPSEPQNRPVGFFTGIFMLVLVAITIQCTCHAWEDPSVINRDFTIRCFITWGAIVMIFVIAVLGILFLDTMFLSCIWTLIGIVFHVGVVFMGDPLNSVTCTNCAVSAVCASIVTWWVWFRAECL